MQIKDCSEGYGLDPEKFQGLLGRRYRSALVMV
jgi:hypothetical protein